MNFDAFTHVVLDRDSGEPLGVVGFVDELADGRSFGLVRWLNGTLQPTFLWLRGLYLLPMSDAAPDVRSQIADALGTAAGI
jgi:hypothetical protein